MSFIYSKENISVVASRHKQVEAQHATHKMLCTPSDLMTSLWFSKYPLHSDQEGQPIVPHPVSRNATSHERVLGYLRSMLHTLHGLGAHLKMGGVNVRNRCLESMSVVHRCTAGQDWLQLPVERMLDGKPVFAVIQYMNQY